MIAAVPAALAVAGAATSAIGAQQQNQAMRRSIQQATAAADVQKSQVNASADAERERRQRETARIRGRIRVATAGSGFTDGAEPFLTQADVDQSLGNQATRLNAGMVGARINSDRDAQITAFQSRYQNPLFSAFTGGLQGLQAGLAITSAAQALSSLSATAPTTAGVYGPDISADTFYGKIKGP